MRDRGRKLIPRHLRGELPPPLWGRVGVGGREVNQQRRRTAPFLTTPTPIPSPQGLHSGARSATRVGGEPRAAAAEISIAGITLVADPAGAMYWPDEKLLVVADLHLEKGSAFAARGVLLPPYDTATTLARLATPDRAIRPACS